jgi:hypothetical protein
MIEVVTVNGSIFLEEPPGFDWDEITNLKIEGHLYYKGFIAAYYRGDEEDGEQDFYFGKIDNIHNAGFCLEGDNLDELTADFHDAVDDFLEQIDRGAYGGHPIEYYTSDPGILEYYNRYHRNKGIFDLERMLTIQKAVMRLETA